MEDYSEIIKNEVVMHATTWLNLENIMISGRRQIQKATYCMNVPKKQMSKRGKSTETESRLVVALGWWG